MSISQQVAEYYGSIRPPADDPGRDWKRLDPSWEKFKFSAPFMEMMDASERQGKLNMGMKLIDMENIFLFLNLRLRMKCNNFFLELRILMNGKPFISIG